MGVRAQTLTMRIWEAQGKCCSICGVKMLPVSLEHPTRGWTWDHVWPRSRFRYCSRGNVLIAHVECNGAKGCRNPTKGERELLERVNVELGLALLEHDGDGNVIGLANPDSRDAETPMGHRWRYRDGWRDGVTGPSALAVALEALLEA